MLLSAAPKDNRTAAAKASHLRSFHSIPLSPLLSQRAACLPASRWTLHGSYSARKPLMGNSAQRHLYYLREKKKAAIQCVLRLSKRRNLHHSRQRPEVASRSLYTAHRPLSEQVASQAITDKGGASMRIGRQHNPLTQIIAGPQGAVPAVLRSQW